jgi:zinc protease
MRPFWLPLVVGLVALGQEPDLRFPPLRPVAVPKVEVFTLSSGLRVYLLENHELPLVSG